MNLDIEAGSTGRCPHCGVTVRFDPRLPGSPEGTFEDQEAKIYFMVRSVQCPNAACNRPVVLLIGIDYVWHKQGEKYSKVFGTKRARLIWPRAAGRPPVPPEVPSHIRKDYEEAADVLSASESASAALSRRCLQALLREVAGSKSKDLADQIEDVLSALPGYLQKQLDAVRNIGNFGAHPQKSKATGEIIGVEPGEAEWNLDVLDLLFDFYFTQPRLAQEKRDALNKKLAEAGKPPMK